MRSRAYLSGWDMRELQRRGVPFHDIVRATQEVLSEPQYQHANSDQITEEILDRLHFFEPAESVNASAMDDTDDFLRDSFIGATPGVDADPNQTATWTAAHADADAAVGSDTSTFMDADSEAAEPGFDLDMSAIAPDDTDVHQLDDALDPHADLNAAFHDSDHTLSAQSDLTASTILARDDSDDDDQTHASIGPAPPLDRTLDDPVDPDPNPPNDVTASTILDGSSLHDLDADAADHDGDDWGDAPAPRAAMSDTTADTILDLDSDQDDGGAESHSSPVLLPTDPDMTQLPPPSPINPPNLSYASVNSTDPTIIDSFVDSDDDRANEQRRAWAARGGSRRHRHRRRYTHRVGRHSQRHRAPRRSRIHGRGHRHTRRRK